MPSILISYRRNDSDDIAGRIRDRIAAQYGDDAVFMDIDSIPFGIDFREHVQEALKQNDVVLAIIGPDWAAIRDDGTARIQDENDPVRVEVETAIRHGKPIVPALVANAAMPTPEHLPATLRDLAFRNAAEVSAGRDFSQHMERVIRSIDRIVELQAERGAAAPQKPEGGGKHEPLPDEPATPRRPFIASTMQRAGLRLEDARQEADFLAAFRDLYYTIGQPTLMGAVAGWIIFGMADLPSGADALTVTRFRYMIAAPVLLLLLSGSFLPLARRYWQPYFSAFTLFIVACTFIALVLAQSAPLFRSEVATMSMMLIAIMVGLMPLTTVYTAGLALIVTLSHAYYIAMRPDLPALAVAFYSLFVALAATAAVIGAWKRESALRAVFAPRSRTFRFS